MNYLNVSVLEAGVESLAVKFSDSIKRQDSAVLGARLACLFNAKPSVSLPEVMGYIIGLEGNGTSIDTFIVDTSSKVKK